MDLAFKQLLEVMVRDESHTAQKMKFFIKDFFKKCDQIRSFTFTEEILNGKLHFLCSDRYTKKYRQITVKLQSNTNLLTHEIRKELPVTLLRK